MTVTPDVRLPCENTWRVTLVFLTNKRPKEKSHVESYLFSQQNFSTARTLNLLLETRSVKRLKMNKHTLHSTRVTACPASSGQTAFRSCSQRVFCSSISRIKRTSARRRASRPLARRCWRDSSGGSGDATGTGRAPRAASRPFPSSSPPFAHPPLMLGRSATGRWQAGVQDRQRKLKGRKVEHFVCRHPFSTRKSTSLQEAQINKGGM